MPTPSGGGGSSSASAFVGAKAHQATGGTSLTNGAWVTIPFDTNDYDSSNFHSTTVNNTRFTVPTTGHYRILGQLNQAQNAGEGATDQFRARLLINGATIIAEHIGNANNTTDRRIVQVGSDTSLNAGDYVELQGFLNVPSGPPVTGVVDSPSLLSIQFLG